jgi:hypothetical protein
LEAIQNLADVDDEGSRHRRRVDPAAVVSLNLQTGLLLLQEKGDEPRILVGPHALIALVGCATGVTDDLDKRVRGSGVDRREHVLGLLEHRSERSQHPYSEGGALLLVGELCRLELRKRRRPLVRTPQARPRRHSSLERQGRPLRADVDLLAPIRLAARMFETGAVIATEMRRIDHFDGKLVPFGQSEEAPRDAQHVPNKPVLDPVVTQLGVYCAITQAQLSLRRLLVHADAEAARQMLREEGRR